MHRFFLPPDCIINDQIQFPDVISHQIARVLRLKSNSSVIVLDNLGNEFVVNLEEINPKRCTGKIIQKKPAENEPNVKLHLFAALTQRDKFELILQKCSEVGVTAITPLVSKRSLLNRPADWFRKKERWERILKEAAEQSGRGNIPSLMEPVDFDKAIESQITLKLIAWEMENQTGLKQILESSSARQAALMIGPEGGFEESEVRLANEAGWIPFSLGKRILRMETAAIVASALILYELGSLDIPQDSSL